MASNKIVVLLLIALIAVTLVETVLIVRSINLPKSESDINVYLPEQSSTNGEVRLVVTNVPQEG